MSGAKYTIIFEGNDEAGNQAPETKVENIVFDNEPPILDITGPLSNSFVNKKSISVSISEDLFEGSLILEQTSGVKDPNSPHKLILDDASRKMGVLEDVIQSLIHISEPTRQAEI